MNAKLRIAQEEAREAAKTKENFFSVVTHELRTPLNAIAGVSGFMKESSLPSEHQENIEVLQSSSKHLLALVNDILDLSKIEAGGLQLESIPFDLHKEVNELKQIFQLEGPAEGYILAFLHRQRCTQIYHRRFDSPETDINQSGEQWDKIHLRRGYNGKY